MLDTDENFEGKTIPKEYWNRLVEWKCHSPADGCWWRMSIACVDAEGNFHPLRCSGRDLNDWMEAYKSDHGLVPGYKDLYDHSDGWHEREEKRIARKHGFDGSRFPQNVVSDIKHEAIKKHFGIEWYKADSAAVDACKEIQDAIREPEERLKAWKKDTDNLERRRQERLNALFMGALLDKTPDQWELYPLDAENIKETCRKFCTSYPGDVGMVCGVLDSLAEMGYDVWCVCSDCGKLFQLFEYEKFSHLIDPDASKGDGGVGVLHTRVQCEQCHEETECPQCQEPNLPNFKVEQGHEYDHYTFEEAFIAQWCDVCEYCADRFTSKNEYKHWSDDISDLEDKIDEDRAQLKKYLAAMKEGGSDEEQLKRLEADNLARMKTVWRGLVNDLRDKMEEDVADFFNNVSERAKDRLTEKDTNYVY